LERAPAIDTGARVNGETGRRVGASATTDYSYVWQSGMITGSFITSKLIGQQNSSGASGAAIKMAQTPIWQIKGRTLPS
jgi:hypothetical protein